MPKEWTTREIRTLRMASAAIKAEYITELLPDRSVGAIRKQMQRRGLRRQDYLAKVIRENRGKPATEIAEIAMCDVRTVRKAMRIYLI